ncbi:hypothetical protein DS2_10838 [Catenovulum agarivorans DS-2]|uniref:Esterase n=1 Tax=Catenovulum agarivorans DS-2 TaxID=1328313 RepID=W7QLG5_9ALTE|nr:alpha/beta hydrolase-fold protein [Catenovulum agarivorans]EWH09777.1 hypothetical protein DS2_10838 [Catenovulum agarivorans DS-2]
MIALKFWVLNFGSLALLLALNIAFAFNVQANTVVKSNLIDGLDSDYPISAKLLPNNPTEIVATKTAKVFNAKQKGKISTPYVIAPTQPQLEQTWYNTPRNYWVYTPYNYKAGDKPNLLLVLDGQRMEKELNLAAMLDYLIEQKQIPPTL